jgi:hypothetical protein
MPRPKQQAEAAPTQEEMQQGAQVAAAAVEGAKNEPNPEKRQAAASAAVQREAQAQGWELTDEECNRIGSAVVNQIEARGGFDAMPEPVQPPPAPTGSGSLPEQPAVQPAHQPHQADPSPAGAQQRRSFAERVRGR